MPNPRPMLCAAVVLAASPALCALHAQTAPVRSRAAAAAAELTLAPGDAVRVTVWRNVELSCECSVATDGSLNHPLYRSLQVTGVPFPEIEARMRQFLQQFELRPQFVVEPLVRVAVGGEVARPNLYLLPPTMTVGQALAYAGGPSEIGRRDRVLMLRGRARSLVDLSGADPTGLQLPVRSGDQLVIERQRSAFRDFVAPVLAVAGSVAAITSVILRTRGR